MRKVLGGLLAFLLVASFALAACSTAAPAPEKTAAQSSAAKPAETKSAESKPTTKAAEPQPATKPAESKPEQKPAAASSANSKDLTTVKVLLLRSISDAGIYIADEKGFFKEQGIAIDYDNASNGSEMIPLLSTNKIDVAGPAINAATFNAIIRGVDMKLVADKGSAAKGFGYTAFVLRKDLADTGKYKDFKDLKGLTIALSPPKDGTANAVDLSNALKKAGLTENDVKITNVAYGDMSAAMANKAIDAAIEIEPLISAGVAKGIWVHWKDMDELYPVRQYTAIAYSPGFAKTEAAKKFMVAYLKGVRAYNDAFSKGVDKAAIISILAKHTTLKDPAAYEKIAPAYLNPNGAIALDNVKGDLQWFKQKGLVQGDVDLSKLIDNQFVDYAVQQLGKYQP